MNPFLGSDVLHDSRRSFLDLLGFFDFLQDGLILIFLDDFRFLGGFRSFRCVSRGGGFCRQRLVVNRGDFRDLFRLYGVQVDGV